MVHLAVAYLAPLHAPACHVEGAMMALQGPFPGVQFLLQDEIDPSSLDVQVSWPMAPGIHSGHRVAGRLASQCYSTRFRFAISSWSGVDCTILDIGT